MSQSARYCFTLNNPTEENILALSNLPCKYLCYSRETAPSTGTPHLQGYVIFKSNQRLSTVAKKIPGAHLSIAKGTSEQNITYCSKEAELVEFGERPKTKAQSGLDEKERWRGILQQAREGTLEEHEPKIYFMHYHKAEKMYADNCDPLPIDRTVKVFYGVTASGKTRKAWEEAGPKAYVKDPRSKFWYGYHGQTNCIIDEFRGGIDISHMLRWLDNYPVMYEIKGSSRPSLVSHIWITSNIHPREWYPDLDAETLAALLRRLSVTHFSIPFAAPSSPGWVTNKYTPSP